MQRDHARIVLLLVAGLAAPSPMFSQRAVVADRANHFPYTFSNFPWWTDSGLRASLKKRIPGLTEELERGSPLEKRIKALLTKLLAEKGVVATVQTIEPAMDEASQKRVQDAPKPSVIFSVSSPPEILIEKLILDNAPLDAVTSLGAIESQLKGQPYTESNTWIEKREVLEALGQLGYLSSAVSIDHGIPVKDGHRYLVPIRVAITAGEQYHVGGIEVDGGPLLEGRDLSSYISVKVGDAAAPNAFGQLEGSLRAVYWQSGFQDVEFSSQPLLDTERALAFYKFDVIPGRQYHLRSIRVENLDSAHEQKVREMLGLNVGDIYDAMAVSQLGSKVEAPESPVQGYSFSFNPVEDKESSVIDLTLRFFAR